MFVGKSIYIFYHVIYMCWKLFIYLFRGRVEYTIEEDLAVIKFLIQKRLYDKVGGNTTWKIVHKVI